MSRINVPARDSAPEEAKERLDELHAQLGVVPNMFRLMANSPEVLKGFSGFQKAVAKTFDLKTRERVALAVAQVNGCDYCLSAHTYMGTNIARISPEEIALNRQGVSLDPKANVVVAFATKVTRERGHVSDADINAVRNAGFTDAQIVEIIAMVAENSFTNYLNEVAKTDIDFPVV